MDKKYIRSSAENFFDQFFAGLSLPSRRLMVSTIIPLGIHHGQKPIRMRSDSEVSHSYEIVNGYIQYSRKGIAVIVPLSTIR